MLAVDRDKVWTYEEYRRLPDDGKRYEIIDGTLYVTPAPRTLHQALSGNLHVLLYQLQLAGQGWVLTARVDVLMPGASPVLPDLVFVAMEQRSILTPDGVDGVPKLVVEILSPSTRGYDRVVKLNKYASCGVAHYWMVDPEPRTLELYELDGATYRLLAALGRGGRFQHPAFPGLELDMDALYQNLPPGIGGDTPD